MVYPIQIHYIRLYNGKVGMSRQISLELHGDVRSYNIPTYMYITNADNNGITWIDLDNLCLIREYGAILNVAAQRIKSLMVL